MSAAAALPDRWSLLALTQRGAAAGRLLSDELGEIPLAELSRGTSLRAPLHTLRDRTVLIATARQLSAVLAMLALDGIARRILLCPPDLPTVHLPAIMAEAGVDAIVSDGTGPAAAGIDGVPIIPCNRSLQPAGPDPERSTDTEWVLFTSGTTGRPKLVQHSLASLRGPLDDGLVGAVWSTFYDVRRYGGLTILLRALLGGGAMVLSSADEPVADFLDRVARRAVTHISGTPSHWRRALMSRAGDRMAPAYVRLSGEVADQAILDQLKAAFPTAGIAHAFASTEAGVGFDVRDGLAGFPKDYVGRSGAGAELRVQDGTLRLRSTRTAACYLHAAAALGDADGFVDTGDLVALHGERYHFVGRREGVINVGGQKIHPEEVEAVINRHPAIRMSRVRGRRNPITGAIVIAEIVLRPDEDGSFPDFPAIHDEVIAACRDALPPYKVPVTLRAVDSLPIAASGKLVRTDA